MVKEERLATGFWLVDFGDVSIYFDAEKPYKDIDLSVLKQKEVKEAADRALDLLFKAIKEQQQCE